MLIADGLAGGISRFNRGFMLYDRLISGYQSHYGKNNICVIPYEKFVSSPGNVVESIKEFAGVEPTFLGIETKHQQRENAGRSLASLEVKRFYNRHIARTRFDIGGITTPEKIQAAANFDPWVPKWFENGLERRFAERVKSGFGDYFAGSNSRVQDLTGLDLSSWSYVLPSGHSPSE